MKLKQLVVLSVVGVALSACGGKNVKQEVADCVFPNTETAAPGWICDEPVPGLDVQAVGISEKSGAGMSFMKDIAAADARGRLAEQVKVKVNKMVKNYMGTTGRGDSETVDAAASSTLKTISSENLVGSKVYKSRTGPNGRLFVLVGIDENAAKKIAETALKTSMNNEKALWQQFVAQKSHDEMAAEIAKEYGR
ncbi:MAG: LPP20 family lipoprotein [Gammaproteobacteria bacterium]|nr:LPP20 family lipoprotein [Gammaproteobacteria bacterium]